MELEIVYFILYIFLVDFYNKYIYIYIIFIQQYNYSPGNKKKKQVKKKEESHSRAPKYQSPFLFIAQDDLTGHCLLKLQDRAHLNVLSSFGYHILNLGNLLLNL